MREKVKNSSCRLLLSELGVTAIEFALVVPILLLLIMGIIEFCLIMYASSVLEGAVISAAREGATGYVPTSPPGQTQTTFIKNLMAQRVTGLLQPSLLRINIQYYTNYSSAPSTPVICQNYNPPVSPPPPAPPQCVQNFGSGGQVAIYSVSYPWPITTPLLQNVFGTGGTFLISSSAVVMNEPTSP